MSETICNCGNPEHGFDCVCNHIKNNPGSNEYSCEFCGLYSASKPRCNKCELDKEYDVFSDPEFIADNRPN